MSIKTTKPLAELRAEIDRIDAAIHALLVERNKISRAVGEAKPAGSPTLRPGREAQVLRSLLERDGEGLPTAVVLRIWREIISASLAQQGDFSIAVAEGPYAAIARDHFGVLIPIRELGSASRVIDAVERGEASIGVLPWPGDSAQAAWWRLLLRADDKRARIISGLPFARAASPASGASERALVVAPFGLEESGQDRSFLGLGFNERLSRSALRDNLEQAGLQLGEAFDIVSEADWTLLFCEVEGFLSEDAQVLEELRERFGDKIEQAQVLGGYAVPLVESVEKTSTDQTGEA